jgi:outer membrane immunogenic protein
MVAGAATANAADLPRPEAPAYKVPAYVAPFYNWSGFYLGINAGGGFGQSSFDGFPPTGNFNTSGGLVGGTVGANWQMSQIVFGLEGDADWSGVQGSSACGFATTCTTSTSWLSTVRGRVGYAFDRFLPYVTGGLALGDINAGVTGFPGASSTQTGWTVGGGLEYAIAGPWTAKVEYLYVDLGKFDCGVSCGALLPPDNVKLQENVIRGGINYRF